MDIEGIHTYYPYTKPSFLEGMARVMDLSGALIGYDASDIDNIIVSADNNLTGEDADAAAIWECWEAVGKDIYYAMGQLARGHRFERE